MKYDFSEYTVEVTEGIAVAKIPFAKEDGTFGERLIPLDKGSRFIKAKDGSYHLVFRHKDGFTAKWGKIPEEDPKYSPWGNEIADIEITTACNGIRDAQGRRAVCDFCYKCNKPNGLYMSFEKFKEVFDLMNQPKTMTQIAFGVDAQCKTNPDVWRIMDYCLENSVVPNVTVADIDYDTAKEIVRRCGACAVSAYERNLGCCHESIENLLKARDELDRKDFTVNIHCLVAEETRDLVWKLLDEIKTARKNGFGNKDVRRHLKKVKAIVLLSLKKKGRGEGFHVLPEDEYRKIVDFCFDNGLPFGMDSCGANKFLRAIENRSDKDAIASCVEPCEKMLFSTYVNVEGKMFPCSFMEGTEKWRDGIDLTGGTFMDYGTEVWNHGRVCEDRQCSIDCIERNGCNSCPYYEV